MHVCMYVVVVEIVIASDYHACSMHVCMYVCGGYSSRNSNSIRLPCICMYVVVIVEEIVVVTKIGLG